MQSIPKKFKTAQSNHFEYAKRGEEINVVKHAMPYNENALEETYVFYDSIEGFKGQNSSYLDNISDIQILEIRVEYDSFPSNSDLVLQMEMKNCTLQFDRVEPFYSNHFPIFVKPLQGVQAAHWRFDPNTYMPSLDKTYIRRSSLCREIIPYLTHIHTPVANITRYYVLLKFISVTH